MSPELRLRRLDALAALLSRLHHGSPAERLEDALDALLDATTATGAAAFDRDPPAGPRAERRLELRIGADPARLRRGLTELAERALSSAAPVRLNDAHVDFSGVAETEAFLEIGANAALAVPLLGERAREGVLVLLFADRAMLDEETLRYVDSVAAITALAIERDHSAQAEARFRAEASETEQMAALGLYAASVAQDLGGPTSALVAQRDELRSLVRQLTILAAPGDDPALGGAIAELGELVADLSITLDRVEGTVSELSTLGRRESSPGPVRVFDIVREAIAMATPHLERRGVLLVEELDSGCFVEGRRDSLRQVVRELVLNAAHAATSAKPGRVWVRVSAESDSVDIRVEDNGKGIDPAHIPQIFSAFVASRQAGRITGLGLKIARDVVAQHGGHIEVDARPGGGAVFRVVLPRAERRASPGSALDSSSHDGKLDDPPSQRLLVVDDDPLFLRTMQRLLKPHEVRTAASASEAEIALFDPGYEPALVLCDVLLPGANGDVLHARVAERRPELAQRFVFVTAGGLGRKEADYLKASGRATLMKPLDVRTILDLLSGSTDGVPGVRTLSELPG
jgi:two-component system NtrC family sensor kinase